MTDDLLQKLMECDVPYAEVWPGSEIWAPVARVEEVKTAVLAALDEGLREGAATRIAAMPADELRAKLTAAGEDPDEMVSLGRRKVEEAKAAGLGLEDALVQMTNEARARAREEGEAA